MPCMSLSIPIRSVSPVQLCHAATLNSGFAARRAVLRRGQNLLLSHQTISKRAQSRYLPVRDTASLLASPKDGSASRPVELLAHVRSVRHQKKLTFLSLGDGSTTRTVQALLAPNKASGLSTGAALKVRGSWRPCPPSKEQTHELAVEEVEIIGPSDPEAFPIQKQHLTPEFLRTLPHLRVRTPTNALLARLRSESEHHIGAFFRSAGFVRLHPPAITSSDCEGAGEVFTVKPREKPSPAASFAEPGMSTAGAGNETEYFKSPKYLTVSNQLHLEAFVHEHQRVWSLAPTFRAERSDTPRHLSEFYMLEAELRCTSLHEVMDVVEGLVRYLCREIQDSFVGKELLELGTRKEGGKSAKEELIASRVEGLRRSYWPRITYGNAIQLLRDAAREKPSLFQFAPEWAEGLHLEHEKYVASKVGNGSPVFVTDYPQHAKPFYMLPTQALEIDSSNSHIQLPSAGPWKAHALPPQPTIEHHFRQAHPTVACFDLLLPDLGELVGGSLREYRHERLKARMDEKGLEGLDWYLELRKFGTVPHGGFGLGFDRLLMFLSGSDSVRDIVQWPRYYGKCDA